MPSWGNAFVFDSTVTSSTHLTEEKTCAEQGQPAGFGNGFTVHVIEPRTIAYWRLVCSQSIAINAPSKAPNVLATTSKALV